MEDSLSVEGRPHAQALTSWPLHGMQADELRGFVGLAAPMSCVRDFCIDRSCCMELSPR